MVAVLVLALGVRVCMGLDVAEIGMGLDLGLDLRLFAARSAGGMAAAAAKGAPAGIEACIRSLEEERRKIEVFRRELPLCVRLLADGENSTPPVVVGLCRVAFFPFCFFSAARFADAACGDSDRGVEGGGREERRRFGVEAGRRRQEEMDEHRAALGGLRRHIQGKLFCSFVLFFFR